MLTKDLGRLSDIMGRKGAMLLALSLFGRFFEFFFENNVAHCCCSQALEHYYADSRRPWTH